MTDEQFKIWAKSFLERTDTYSSWRGAAVEAIQMLEGERAKNAKLVEELESTRDKLAIAVEALEEIAKGRSWIGGRYSASEMKTDEMQDLATEALAKIKGEK